jgi:uncharacterized protein YbjT (DUF2867 family)
LKAGKPVTVVGRDSGKLQKFVTLGAKTAIGDIADATFLTHAFEGAKAVYTLIPPSWTITNWRLYQIQIATAIIIALAKSGVKNVVNLSSQGAHLPEGAGPVSGLYYVEQMLNAVPNLNVRHLRPGFFMQNFYGFMGLIKHAGVFGQSLKSDIKMPVVHTRDIANVATQNLLNLDFKGSSVAFIGGAADLNMNEVTAILGKSIGKPDLPYIIFSREDEIKGMVQNGIPATIAHGYSDLFNALNFGDYQGDGYARTVGITTPTSFEFFVENEFKHAFLAG